MVELSELIVPCSIILPHQGSLGVAVSQVTYIFYQLIYMLNKFKLAWDNLQIA